MLNRRSYALPGVMLAALVLMVMPTAVSAAAASRAENRTTTEPDRAPVSLENDYAKYVIGPDGRNLHLIDKRTGTDYCRQKPPSLFVHVKIGKQVHRASSVSRDGERIVAGFGATGVRAVIRPIVRKHYFVFEVVSVDGKDVTEFTFVDVPLTLKGQPDEPFVACAMALNLQTNVVRVPQPSSWLIATCYARFGFAGARVGVIACPPDQLRGVMKEVVSAAPDLPRSDIGGPWALDAPISKGSYLFNFGGMSEQTVDDWIKLARDLGINQIDFHGGSSFRFGDCRPNPKTYPNGFASLKAVIDRLHAAGIKAGLHTYAFFIDKTCPWVTPVPDRRLASDATFTLAKPLTADAATVPVVETTQPMSTTVGFFVRNSVTLRIDDELLTYEGITKTPPYAFTQCKRGVCGTKAVAHAAGAKAYHLKQCFFRFVPDPNTTLFTEVAAKTAEAFNTCGFDMMYMDALDGEDILGGRENGWHYGSKFVFEICKRLHRPAAMEMSTFHHHLWYVRSRMGALDHPTRSHKTFIDFHCRGNEALRRMFLPGHLGWWAVKTWTGHQGEPTFADDIEYLCGKCIGTGVGFSVMGIDPKTIKTVPVYRRLAAIMKRYEDLRHKNYFDASVKAKLAEPGKEFTLFQDAGGRWRFRRVQYAKHKIEGVNGWSNVWSTDNPFDAQPVRLRIEALLSAGPYDADGNVTLADFAKPGDFADRASAKGVTATLESTSEHVKAGKVSGALTAANAGTVARKGAWAKLGRTFEPPRDLSKHQALGLWVHGDGKGEVLNVQLKSPSHLSHGIGDHYVIVDFAGWRYVELIEPEGERHSHYAWPYGGLYSIYRESVNDRHVDTLRLWYNHLAPKATTTCYLSPIKALPLASIKIKNPAITIAGKKIVFPVEMASGSYLEFNAPSDCTLYSPKGSPISQVAPQGEAPVLRRGANEVTFTCDGPTDLSARAQVTVISQGEPI